MQDQDMSLVVLYVGGLDGAGVLGRVELTTPQGAEVGLPSMCILGI